MLREVLEREGHAVMEAGDGREGITLARNIPIDLIITDLLMPELDGLEVIQTLRSDSPQVKIIAISGGSWQRKINMLKAVELLGAARSLQKPFSIKELCQAVQEVLKAP
jgi:DNA-binding response OmpR family regulator